MTVQYPRVAVLKLLREILLESLAGVRLCFPSLFDDGCSAEKLVSHARIKLALHGHTCIA